MKVDRIALRLRHLPPTLREEIGSAYGEDEDFSPYLEDALSILAVTHESPVPNLSPELNRSLAPVLELTDLTRGQSLRQARTGIATYGQASRRNISSSVS